MALSRLCRRDDCDPAGSRLVSETGLGKPPLRSGALIAGPKAPADTVLVLAAQPAEI